MPDTNMTTIQSFQALCEKIMERTLDKSFPVDKWLKEKGITCDVLFPYKTYDVKLGGVTFEFDDDETGIRGPVDIVRSDRKLAQYYTHFALVFSEFQTNLPFLKAQYVRLKSEELEKLKSEIRDLEGVEI
jgi:hypothetical protein